MSRSRAVQTEVKFPRGRPGETSESIMTAEEERSGTHRLSGGLAAGRHAYCRTSGWQLERRKSETDWAAFDALTDEQIEEAVRNDPDAVASRLQLVRRRPRHPAEEKGDLDGRVDEDVLDYFKHEGAGYQRRMNAVLRSFIEQKKSKKKRAK